MTRLWAEAHVDVRLALDALHDDGEEVHLLVTGPGGGRRSSAVVVVAGGRRYIDVAAAAGGRHLGFC